MHNALAKTSKLQNVCTKVGIAQKGRLGYYDICEYTKFRMVNITYSLVDIESASVCETELQGFSMMSHVFESCLLLLSFVGERERANLVVQLARDFPMYPTMQFGPVYKLCTCIWDP